MTRKALYEKLCDEVKWFCTGFPARCCSLNVQEKWLINWSLSLDLTINILLYYEERLYDSRRDENYVRLAFCFFYATILKPPHSSLLKNLKTYNSGIQCCGGL